MAVMVGGSILAGVIVALSRLMHERASRESQSVVRSWVAITLVIGLLSSCAAAFEIDDVQLRNTLLGGLVASVGAAIAFYFSSKGAEGARADFVKATTALARGGVAPTRFSAKTPPKATKGAAYKYAFVADGTPPLTYRLGSGRPPDGLQLEPDGSVHGIPADTAETESFTVVASNAAGSLASADVALEVT